MIPLHPAAAAASTGLRKLTGTIDMAHGTSSDPSFRILFHAAIVTVPRGSARTPPSKEDGADRVLSPPRTNVTAPAASPGSDALVAYLKLSGSRPFRSGPRVRSGAVFGGELLALGLRAAAACAPHDVLPHSLHAFFLRGGDGAPALVADVTPVRDGRSLRVREVSISAGAGERCRIVVSFHRAEDRDDYAAPPPLAPDPDGPGPWRDDPFTYLDDSLPFDVRHVSAPTSAADPATVRFWARTRGQLPAEPVLHLCAQAMASDMRTGVAAAAPLKAPWGGAISLDHVMWFHRPIRADEWFLVDIRPHSVAAGRGLVAGSVYAPNGTLGASFGQELLVRPG